MRRERLLQGTVLTKPPYYEYRLSRIRNIYLGDANAQSRNSHRLTPERLRSSVYDGFHILTRDLPEIKHHSWLDGGDVVASSCWNKTTTVACFENIITRHYILEDRA
ncbi:hypothetical protein WG66_004211 [Moniliophthora roreri]|nr:hypothetical protein WG66_004211 [Moniliophthora roreri]